MQGENSVITHVTTHPHVHYVIRCMDKLSFHWWTTKRLQNTAKENIVIWNINSARHLEWRYKNSRVDGSLQKDHQEHLGRRADGCEAGSQLRQVGRTVDIVGHLTCHMPCQRDAATLHCDHCSKALDSGSTPVITMSFILCRHLTHIIFGILHIYKTTKMI